VRVPRAHRARRPGVLLAVLVALAALAGCSSGGAPAPAPSPSTNHVLGDGVRFYRDPHGHAQQAVALLEAHGRHDEADRLRRGIASRPTAIWLTPVPEDVYAETRSVTTAAARQGAVPVLVAYNLPGRDCGLYSSGGAGGIDAYLQWVGSLAAGIGDRRAVVVLEPDAVAHALEGCTGGQAADERYRTLAEAVAILERHRGTRVYLDAGNASWVEDLDALAGALEASGVRRADGFALNVSNFETTERSVRYGDELSARLGGAHYVVDTSRNGAGAPVAETATGSHRAWCNPVGRRVGTAPTVRTGHRLVDAFLWVKQPGDSDGTCRDGAPPAGQWWPSYATELLGGAPS
jgi:endoglucanase